MSGKIEKEDKFLLDSTRDEQAIKEFKMKAYKKTGIIQWYLKRDEDEEERIRLEIVPEKTGMRHVWTQAKKEHRSDLRDRLESEYSLDPTEVDLKNLETLPFVVKIRHYLEPKNKGIKEVILDEFLEKWKCDCDYLVEIEMSDGEEDRTLISKELSSWEFLKDLSPLDKEESKKFENKKLAKNHEENGVFKIIQFLENRLKPEQVVVALQGLSFFGKIPDLRTEFECEGFQKEKEYPVRKYKKKYNDDEELSCDLNKVLKSPCSYNDIRFLAGETDSLQQILNTGYIVSDVEYIVFPDRPEGFSRDNEPAIYGFLKALTENAFSEYGIIVHKRPMYYTGDNIESLSKAFTEIWTILDKIREDYPEKEILIDVTGGQKYPGIMASLYCIFNNLPFFYIFEGEVSLAKFPPVPASWDFGAIDEALAAFNSILVGNAVDSSERNHLKYSEYCSLPETFRNLYTASSNESNLTSSLPLHVIESKYRKARGLPFGYGEDFLRLLDDNKCTEERKKLTKAYKEYLRKMIREVWSLQWIGDQIPETVEHSQRHSKRLMEFTVNLINTIGEENFLNGVPKSLKNEFYFVLAIAMNVHDLGHTKLSYKLGDGRILPLDSLPCVVRDLHHELSYQMLEDDDRFKLFGERPDTCEEKTWEKIKTAVKLVTRYHREYMPINGNPSKLKEIVKILSLEPEPLEEVVSARFEEEDWQRLTIMASRWLKFIDGTDVQSDRTVEPNYFKTRVLRTITEIEALGMELESNIELSTSIKKEVSDLVKKVGELKASFEDSENNAKKRELAEAIKNKAEALEKASVYPMIQKRIDECKGAIIMPNWLKLLSKLSFKALQFTHFEKHNMVNYVYPRFFMEESLFGNTDRTLRLSINIQKDNKDDMNSILEIIDKVKKDIVKEFKHSGLNKFAIKTIKMEVTPLSEKILITPLGTSPGVLYTLIKRLNPDRVIVITSKKGEENLPEICEKAGFDQNKIKAYLFDDPYTGFDKISDVIKEMISDFTIDIGSRITVNLAGGTSFLQYVTGEFSEVLESKKLDVTKVFAVDRRDFALQKAEPYVVGEVVELPGEDSWER